ncbi:MAG: hypothetical protein IJ654_02035 [Bacteroidales bacterium]|nr:hypothetical protein [Bacteroidales bacterium]
MKKILLALTVVLFALSPAFAQEKATVNKKNLIVKEWNTNGKGARTLDHVIHYSPEGRKIDETEYDSNGKQKWRKRYEWGENGRMARELVYDEHNRLVNYKTFDYNDLGKKKVQYTYDPKGKLISTKVYEYIIQDV